jgi:5-formyltetrahydrofolate cyclo-ligase
VKQAIREEVLRKRNHIPREVRSVKNLLIKERMISLPEFVSSHTILFYASFRSEAETSGMIKESIGAGKRVLLPKVDRENKKLWLYEIKDISELSPGYMGIPEPSLDDGRIVSPENIDLVVIPGAGFDYSGNRLGYGAGYYDRLLSETGGKLVIVAPAFEEQIVDMIPAEGHDVKVNIIVTDKRILRV